MEVLVDLPLKGGKARARLYKAGPDTYGLTLTDFTGKPVGKGKSLSERTMLQFKQALDACKSLDAVHSLIWATIGYGRKDTRPLASTYTHPGRRPF